MKRGMAGRTRRGAPPLRRQRGALRVVQLTLLGLAGMLAVLAADAVRQRGKAAAAQGIAPSSLLEVVMLALFAVLSLAGALAIGVRTVRGPEPPPLD